MFFPLYCVCVCVCVCVWYRWEGSVVRSVLSNHFHTCLNTMSTFSKLSTQCACHASAEPCSCHAPSWFNSPASPSQSPDCLITCTCHSLHHYMNSSLSYLASLWKVLIFKKHQVPDATPPVVLTVGIRHWESWNLSPDVWCLRF